MRKNDLVYLKHIRESIETIDSYLDGVDYLEFMENKMMFDATVKQLENIGEASNNISQEFIANHPEFPWRDMKDTRNFLIHEYFGINAETVWGTCKEDLPKLKNAIEKVL